MATRPVAGRDVFEFFEDETVTGNILANDSDPEGDTLYLRFFDGISVGAKKGVLQKTTIAGDYGTFTLQPNGTFSYVLNDGTVLNEGQSVTERLTVKISDAGGSTNVSSFTLTILGKNEAPINIAPVAEDATFAGIEDSSITGQVDASDLNGDVLTYSVSGVPAHGSVSITPGGAFTYIPDANWFGTDSFDYQVSDGKGGFDTATVTLNAAQAFDDLQRTNVTKDANSFASGLVLSADGSTVAFHSSANTLTPGDSNGFSDIFLYDTATHDITNVTQAANHASYSAALSADGSTLAFHSYASNLTIGDNNGKYDIFLYDTDTHAFTNITQGANGPSYDPSLSADGSIVAFESGASNLTPGNTNGQGNIFLYDTATQTMTNVTQGANRVSQGAVVSADGSMLVFRSYADNLTPGDTNGREDIFLYDTATQAIVNVTQSANSAGSDPVLSADGSTLAFTSYASNLTPGDTNGREDVFLYDTATHTLTNVTQHANRASFGPMLSADGTTLAFHSGANNLTAGDTNGRDDIFLYDIATQSFTNVTQDSNGYSYNPVLSANGSTIAFYSAASNLTADDTNGREDIFVYDWV